VQPLAKWQGSLKSKRRHQRPVLGYQPSKSGLTHQPGRVMVLMSERRKGAAMDGAKMREVRQQLRLTQTALKDALNERLRRSYDKPKISRWENGHELIPDDVQAELRRMLAEQPRNARILALANQKGGVGKTTSAMNLVLGLSNHGKRALLVDMDPQATATIGLLAQGAVEAYRREQTMAHIILHGRTPADAILPMGTAAGGARALPFDFLASHIDLAEVDGRREPGFDAALRERLDEIRDLYDYIVVDAPPNLGMLTWMALTAAQDVIIPVRTEPYDTMGVGLILGTVNKVQRRLNPSLRLTGILPTQYSRRKSVDREVLGHLIVAMGSNGHVLEPVPESAVFGHASRDGRIALEAYPTSSAVAVYARLAEAIVTGRVPRLAEVEGGGNHQEGRHGESQ
jgi:chromosome partitioning protein